MDWKSIAGAVAPLAPKLGAVLGTSFGGPLGGIIGGLAGNALASVFGVEPTPEAVGKAIVQDPEAADKIRDLEEARGEEIRAQAQVQIEALKQATEQFRIGADDTEHARQAELERRRLNPESVPWGQVTLATIFNVGFFVMLAIFVTHSDVIKENPLLALLMGCLVNNVNQTFNYYFGSSAGSRVSSDRFSALASQIASQPNPSPAAVTAIKAATAKKK